MNVSLSGFTRQLSCTIRDFARKTNKFAFSWTKVMQTNDQCFNNFYVITKALYNYPVSPVRCRMGDFVADKSLFICHSTCIWVSPLSFHVQILSLVPCGFWVKFSENFSQYTKTWEFKLPSVAAWLGLSQWNASHRFTIPPSPLKQLCIFPGTRHRSIAGLFSVTQLFSIFHTSACFIIFSHVFGTFGALSCSQVKLPKWKLT